MTPSSKSLDLSRSCTAVVFCGGRATRLQDHLKGSPKALVLLHRIPYLYGLLQQIAKAGLNEVLICVSPFSKEIIDTIRSGRRFGLNVRYSVDTGLHENADALWQARTHIHTRFAICLNGDTVFDVNFNHLLQAHLRSDAIATLVASERTDQPHPGAIETRTDGRVVDLHEWLQDHGRRVEPSAFSNTYSNSGIYVFDICRLVRFWLTEDRIGKIEQGLLRSLAAGDNLHAFKNGTRFVLDIGTPERLVMARSYIQEVSRFVAA